MALLDNQVQSLTAVSTRHPALFSLALGAVAASGFAPFDLWPLALLSLAAWMWLIQAAPNLKQALLRGWLFGVGHFALCNNWLQHPFVYQDAMPQWLGYVAVLLAALYLAIYPMLAAGLAWRLAGRRGTSGERSGASFVLVFGAAWIAAEWLRATMLTGYPWNPLGAIWVPLEIISGMARLIGTYALSGITIVIAGALMIAVQGRWRFPAAVTVAAAVLAVGAVDWSGMATKADSATAPHVRIVQTNLGEEVRPTADYAENSMRALEALAGAPGAHPRLIVWPEGALRYYIEDGYPFDYYWQGAPAPIRRRIAALLGPRDLVLGGGSALQFDKAGNLKTATNSIFAIDARANLLARYDKAHLVPFGEYLPLRPLLTLFGLQRLVPGDIDFAPGPGPRTIALPGFGDVGMEICYEIIFSGQVVAPGHRPAVIFNPSNDSWFGTWGPPQHLAQARLRAIEEGLPIIRSTPTGISAVIDADGRVLDSIGLNRTGAIELPIPRAHPPTLFSRVGNWMALIAAAAMLFFAVAIRRASR